MTIPAPPTADDFEGLEDDLAAPDPTFAIIPAPVFAEDMERMLPLVDALVAGFAAGRVRMEDPDERLALVELRRRVVPVIDRLELAVKMIDKVFLQYAVEENAERIRLPDDRLVMYDRPRGEYTTQAAPLRTALAAISRLDGSISMAEVDEALKVEQIVRPNHTKLNALAKRYGGAVKEAIDAHRTFIAPDPARGRVRFPR